MAKVPLAQLPVLREAYGTGAFPSLATWKKPRYPVRADLLDRVSLWQGDITKLEVDAIVNAANESLNGGDGGVDDAIHRAAGKDLLSECLKLGGCEIGCAKITKGHKLPSKHIIHTVGPIYYEVHKVQVAEELKSCYKSCVDITASKSLRHVAFCSISTGTYEYPIYDATHIALDTVRTFLETEAAVKVERVVFVVFSDKDKRVYEELIPEYFPIIGEPERSPAAAETKAEAGSPSAEETTAKEESLAAAETKAEEEIALSADEQHLWRMATTWLGNDQ